MELDKLLESLLPQLGQKGVDALETQISDLGDGQEGWKKTLLSLVANGVETYGPQGVQKATDAVMQLLDGDEPPDINWADLEVASDLLGQLQNAEADQKSQAKEYLAKVNKTLGPILSGVLKGLIATLI